MDTSSTLLDSLRRSPESDAWAQLNQLYRPMISRWLQRAAHHPLDQADIDDITQEVLRRIAEKITSFVPGEHRGGFRKWLKLIAINCLRNYARKNQKSPAAIGGTAFAKIAQEMESPDSPLSQQWEVEHQQSVLKYLMNRIQPEFEAATWQIFLATAIDQQTPKNVAEKHGVSVASVYTAKSRVLSRLRQLGQGMLQIED